MINHAQNKKHPHYDPAMELLACIPPHPGHAEMNAIRDDLRLNAVNRPPESLRTLVGRLRTQHGIALMSRRVRGDWALSVPREDWARARAKAERYWRVMYGASCGPDSAR